MYLLSFAASGIGALLAAIFGLIDWITIPSDTRAKRIGLWHGLGNVVIVLLFIVSWLIRLNAQSNPNVFAYILSIVGVVLALFTGWLGGELVDRLGVGVDAYRGRYFEGEEGVPVGAGVVGMWG